MTREQLSRLSDHELRGLSDAEFWNAFDPDGVDPANDDPRLFAESLRRGGMVQPIVEIFQCCCPHCGRADGPLRIGQSRWFYCRTHKVKWLAGYDLSASTETDEQQMQHYNEIGFGDFKYLGPDAEAYYQAATGAAAKQRGT